MTFADKAALPPVSTQGLWLFIIFFFKSRQVPTFLCGFFVFKILVKYTNFQRNKQNFYFVILIKSIFFCNLYNKKSKIRKTRISGPEKKAKKRKLSCKYKLEKFEKYKLVCQLAVTINRHFPDFYRKVSSLPDYRKRPKYEVKELIVSGLLLFLFKQKSRNQADNTAKNYDYQDNIKSIFGIKVADMDTVDKYLRWISPCKLEQIKQDLFRELVKSKTFQKYKFAGKYFMLAIDGSGLQSYDYEPYPGCPYKKSKNGKKVWTTYVLEAKVVTSNGFSISLATEWIENPTNGTFDKQDCEIKAFKRLAIRLKKEFPRLPLVLLLDSLYPRDPVFSICKTNNWRYIITLKDKNLKSVQEQIADKLLFKDYGKQDHLITDKTHWLKNDYKFFEGIEYKAYTLYVAETLFEKQHKLSGEKQQTRFVHVTDIFLNENNVHQTSQAGRLRWKIENEGFNSQKNNGYNAEHKFSRTNFNATKNYYQLMQIADIINQLTYKIIHIQGFIKNFGLTINALIKEILSYLKAMEFDDFKLIEDILAKNIQLRY